MSELLNSLLQDINNGKMDLVEGKLSELTEDQINSLFAETQPYKTLGTASSDKIVIGAVTNLREKYLKKLITTTMVGFLFQMKDEYTIEKEELTARLPREDFFEPVATSSLPENFDEHIPYCDEVEKLYNAKFPDEPLQEYKAMEAKLSEEELLEASINASNFVKKLSNPDPVFNSAKYDEALKTAIQEQSDTERVIINRFLEKLFKYKRNVDLQKGNHPVGEDPERKSLKKLKKLEKLDEHVYKNIPPNDTHCRFNAYYDINYEEMREATLNLYNVKPDLEHAMIVYDVADTQAEVDAFINKYGSTSKYDIITFPLNRWTLMGPFKNNRSRVDYYNKHNSIIKSMLEQQEIDSALGEDLMKKRVRSKKVQAQKVYGKDSEGFKTYRQMHPESCGSIIEEVDDDTVKVTREVVVDTDTGKELEVDEDGVPVDALEVPVVSINAKTGETSTSRFFTASEESR